MKLPLANCPNCHSLQKFAPHNEGDKIVMRCHMCRMEMVVENDRPTRTLRRPSLPQVR